MTNEAFSRVKIDAQLRDQGWEITNTNAVRFEYVLPDRTKADYVLCDRNGRSLAVVEAKKAAINPAEAEAQAKAYAVQLKVPYIFLANGDEIRFWEWQTRGLSAPGQDLLLAGRPGAPCCHCPVEAGRADGRDRQAHRRARLPDRLHRRPVPRDRPGRRKLLVEMATGTGKTRTAAAFIKRLFEADAITRVLFLVDRIPAGQANRRRLRRTPERLPGLRAARRAPLSGREAHHHHHAAEHGEHLSRVLGRATSTWSSPTSATARIYGKWSGVLKHFDGVQVGLTATPASLTLRPSTTRKTSSSSATPCASSRSIGPPSATR